MYELTEITHYTVDRDNALDIAMYPVEEGGTEDIVENWLAHYLPGFFNNLPQDFKDEYYQSSVTIRGTEVWVVISDNSIMGVFATAKSANECCAQQPHEAHTMSYKTRLFF